jgi:molybdenum cofactor guanylyltransferase
LPALHDISALILAGGRASRMGGVDKGLQNFRGLPLALHTLLRLQAQTSTSGSRLAEILINANRNLAAYEAMGATVWPDAQADFAGPLAGFLSGLSNCESPYLLTVPCDTPLLPLDLADRLAQALTREQADIAMAVAPDTDGRLRTQPVFCLLRAELMPSLLAFTQQGGRKIDEWTQQHTTVCVNFDQAQDDPRAFFNVNTLAELHALEAAP